jgi:hypothetical protein
MNPAQYFRFVPLFSSLQYLSQKKFSFSFSFAISIFPLILYILSFFCFLSDINPFSTLFFCPFTQCLCLKSSISQIVLAFFHAWFSLFIKKLFIFICPLLHAVFSSFTIHHSLSSVLYPIVLYFVSHCVRLSSAGYVFRQKKRRKKIPLFR